MIPKGLQGVAEMLIQAISRNGSKSRGRRGFSKNALPQILWRIQHDLSMLEEAAMLPALSTANAFNSCLVN